MEITKRKAIRLEKFDYSKKGYYFITICTKNREKFLCDIVGDGVLDVPKIVLSETGKVIEDIVLSINNVSGISVDKYVIMPNHIHLILKIDGISGTSRTPSPTNAMIPKTISGFKRLCNKMVGYQIFQRSFYDHIIRNEKDYLEICNYIENNPLKWKQDSLFIN